MAKVQVKLGSAARKELFFALDSASTTGAGKTGASGTMAAYYVRNDTTPTATSIATPSFTEVSSVNMPGVYYLTVPVGAFATGATTCAVMITGTGMAPVLMEYQLVAYDPDSGTNLGLSALPTAATGTAGGLITSGTGTAQLTTTSGVVTANTTQWNGTGVTGMPLPTASYTTPPTAASISTTVWSETNRVLTAGTNIVLAKGTGITGFNDLSSTNVADAVWNAVVFTYDPTSGNTTATFAKALLKSDAQSKNGDVTMYSVSGTNGIDVDVHRISNDVTAATNLKALLMNTSTVTLGGQFNATGNAAVADKVLGRSIAGGADGGRTVTDALRILRNKFTASGTSLTVYAENDTSVAWTSVLSTDAAATPVTGSDPA